MPVDDAPADEDVRETYNFPPGASGLVYRADVPDHGIRDETEQHVEDTVENADTSKDHHEVQDTVNKAGKPAFNYQLKAMKWGLIPFWTKRSPDYGSMMRTINCRDDSLIENRGMWNTMKQRKRCVVIAQGFYEWLKKGPGGKEKIPHFVKRKDGNLMCFAGLWDCVKYEDTDEKLYTYTIITTDSNKQLTFLHDRMPVILEPNSESMKLWLDPTQNKWTKDLQSMLRPYEGDLDCYPVNKEVGKVGNNSPDFIVPIDSKENKKNIANFFGNAAKKSDADVVKKENAETRETIDHDSSENHAPLPVPETIGSKRKHEDMDNKKSSKVLKTAESPLKAASPPKPITGKKTRNAVSNEGSTLKTSPLRRTDSGTQKITSFFAK